MRNEYILRDSIVEDMPEIAEVCRITWLATYPNDKEGITVEDVESVYEVDKDSAEYKAKQEKRAARYTDSKFHIWVAESSKKIVGFCSVVKEEDANRVMAIYVLPNYQGRGIGKALMTKAFEWFGNSKDILVNVVRYNNNAINFYSRMGFEKTEREGVIDDIARLPTGKVIPEIQMVRKLAKINLDNLKVDRDLDFLQKLIGLSKKHNWRVIVSGGYGLDILLGKITRNHNDLDVIIYGQDIRDDSKKLIPEFLNRELDKPSVRIVDEDYFVDIDVNTTGLGANLYFVETIENPFKELHKVRRKDGSVVVNSEERFPSPVVGRLDGMTIEVQNPNTHLADILRKRKYQTHPPRPEHDQDIVNLKKITESQKVEKILSLM